MAVFIISGVNSKQILQILSTLSRGMAPKPNACKLFTLYESSNYEVIDKALTIFIDKPKSFTG